MIPVDFLFNLLILYVHKVAEEKDQIVLAACKDE